MREHVTIASNYLDDESKAKAREALESGKTIHFCATCIGHTRAQILEAGGANYIKSLYGKDRVEEIYEDGYFYYRLK